MILSNRAPNHHPDPEALLAYAAGSLGEANAVLVATHLALCPRCRAEVARLEAVGGALTEVIEPVAMADGALERALAALDQPAQREAAPARLYDDETLRTVPAPLRTYLDGDLSRLPWRWRGVGVRELPLPIGDSSLRTSLIRVRGGSALPVHTHDGVESTLVLTGSFSDSTGRYARGDVEMANDETVHQPIADPGGECMCLIVVDGPLRLTGPLGRLLNPLLRL